MRELAGRIFAIWVGLWMILLAFATCFFIFPMIIVPRGRREQLTTPIGAAYCWLCTRIILGVTPDIRGQSHIPSQPGYLVICNHRSWLDVALLVYATRSLGIAKKELIYIPFFGISAWVAGVIFFDRSDKNSRAQVVADAITRMKLGANLHVFPEGTRTRTGKLASKTYLRLLEHCFDAQIPVIPACTWNTEKTLPTGKIWASHGQPAGLEISPPLYPSQFSNPHQFAQAAWNTIITHAQQHGSDQLFD